MNGLILVSIVINVIVAASLSSDPQLPGGFTLFMGLFVVISIVGAIMIAAGSRKPGAIMVIIGCITFVPIGLIGVFGAKKVLDELARENFENETA